MPNETAVKVVTGVLYVSLGYTAYRASLGVSWTIDKGKERWQYLRAKPLRIVR